MKKDRFEISLETKHGINAEELNAALRVVLHNQGRHPGEIVVNDEPLHHREEREELERGEN